MRTLDEALSYLDYHSPNEESKPKHENINRCFQVLLVDIWDSILEGPGKTVAIRAIGRARMECNSAIANKGN